MKTRTAKNRKFQFNEKARREICARDGETCIFCRRGYHMENKDTLLYRKKDIMHYVNKSQGGLGIPENGAVGCRYHHMLLDNGNRGLRAEMLGIFRDHLKECYPEWDEGKLKYTKWNFPTIG